MTDIPDSGGIPNVVAATYAEWQMVKTRGVLVLKFECPIEQTEHVMKVLGVPRPDAERWFAICPLVDGTVKYPKAVLGGDRALRQCHALCREQKFQRWIVRHPTFGILTTHGDYPEPSEATARAAILDYCMIKSRGDLLNVRGALDRWELIVLTFRKETGMSD